MGNSHNKAADKGRVSATCSRGWRCRRCKSLVVDQRCECEESPSPWEMFYTFEGVPSGDYKAWLPNVIDFRTRVYVSEWANTVTDEREKIVEFMQGTRKHEYLTPHELEGAEFYPENAEGETRQGNSDEPSNSKPL